MITAIRCMLIVAVTVIDFFAAMLTPPCDGRCASCAIERFSRTPAPLDVVNR